MVTAIPRCPMSRYTTDVEIATEPDVELAEAGDGSRGGRGERCRRPSPRCRRSDDPGSHLRRGAGELPAPAGDRDREPEGRRGQDHHRGEPGRRARRSRVPGARRRPRPPGQRLDRARDQPPRRRVLDLRRDHDRRARPRLRRAHQPEEPLRAAGDHRPRRGRDRAGLGIQPRAEAAAGARRGAAGVRHHPHRLPALARAPHRQRAGRRRRRDRPGAERVLRARGAGPAPEERRHGAIPQPDPRRPRASCSPCTTPAPSWPSRSRARSGSTSGRGSTRRLSRGRCDSRRRRRSGSRSSCSIRRRVARRRTGSWRKR